MWFVFSNSANFQSETDAIIVVKSSHFLDKMLASLLLLSFVIIKPSFENETVVFEKGESGYFCIRIPSLLTTAKGTLIAFGEGRMYTCDDNTQKDIVYKRCLDDGKT